MSTRLSAATAIVVSPQALKVYFQRKDNEDDLLDAANRFASTFCPPLHRNQGFEAAGMKWPGRHFCLVNLLAGSTV